MNVTIRSRKPIAQLNKRELANEAARADIMAERHPAEGDAWEALAAELRELRDDS